MTLTNLKVCLILIILVSTFDVYSQSSDLFDNKIETLPDKKVKIYLNNLFRITNKECSKFYIITEFENHNYRFHDSLKSYYTFNDGLHMVGKFNNGRLHGKFKSYNIEGKLEMTSEYVDGKRDGIWQTYNENGEIEKKIIYRNGSEFLMYFYDKERNLKVSNGNGTFEDLIVIAISSDHKGKVMGNVKDGLPDGEWNFYVDKVNTGKEYFKDFIFEKGISLSLLGNSEYYDDFYATYIGRLPIDNLKLLNGYECNKNNKFGVGTDFYEKITRMFYEQGLDKVIKNGWFLIDISIGNNRKVKDVNIISNSDENHIDLMKTMILNSGSPILVDWSRSNISSKADFEFIALVVKNSKLYSKIDTGGIELLEFKF